MREIEREKMHRYYKTIYAGHAEHQFTNRKGEVANL